MSLVMPRALVHSQAIAKRESTLLGSNSLGRSPHRKTRFIPPQTTKTAGISCKRSDFRHLEFIVNCPTIERQRAGNREINPFRIRDLRGMPPHARKSRE